MSCITALLVTGVVSRGVSDKRAILNELSCCSCCCGDGTRSFLVTPKLFSPTKLSSSSSTELALVLSLDLRTASTNKLSSNVNSSGCNSLIDEEDEIIKF